MKIQNPKDLEEKVWYRIAKVLYGIGWLFVILSVPLTIYVLQPNTYIDMDKSYFTCPDGSAFETKGMTRDYQKEGILSHGDDQRARATCANRQAYSEDVKNRQDRARQEGYDENTITQLTNEYITKADPSNVYTLTLVKSTNGSWDNAFMWVIGVGIVGYGALELIKKTVMYITTGKKFQPYLIKNR